MGHLESCSSCAPEHRQTARLSEILNGLQVPNPGEGYWRGLSAAVQSRVQQGGSSQRTSVVRSKPLLAAAAALIAALCVAIILATFRGQDVLAAAMAAMEGVHTEHGVTTLWLEDGTVLRHETWISAGHGIREELDGVLIIHNPEGRWTYTRSLNRVQVSDPEPRAAVRKVRAPASLLEKLQGLRKLDTRKRFRVSEEMLDGEAATRMDFSLGERQRMTYWFNNDSMLPMAYEVWDLDQTDRWVLTRRSRIEYDVPIDPALFKFEPPPEAKVRDLRGSDPW